MLRDLLAPDVRIEVPMASEFLDEEEAADHAHPRAGGAPQPLRPRPADGRHRLRRLGQDDARGRAGEAPRREGRATSSSSASTAPFATTCASARGESGVDFQTFHGLCMQLAQHGRGRAAEYPKGEAPPELLGRGAAGRARRGDRRARAAVRRALRRRGPGPRQRLARRADVHAARSRRGPASGSSWTTTSASTSSSSTCPTEFRPFDLTVNCRNTQAIHREVMKKYEGEVEPEVDRARGPRGRAAPDRRPGRRRSPRVLERLCGKEEVPPQDVVVLSSHGFEQLGGRAVASPAAITFVKEPEAGRAYVRFSSIRGFKGLESPVVILCELEDLDDETHRPAALRRRSRGRGTTACRGAEG